MSELFLLKNGLIQYGQYLASPNYSQRPKGIVVDMIVIHNISLPPGEYAQTQDYVSDFFCNRLDVSLHPFFKEISTQAVSAHFYIRRNGALKQYVPTHERAWHAGPSFYQGRSECNDFSIGIELEGSDYEPFSDAQYRVLIPLINTLQQYYPAISNDRIVGHSDIAPDRKTDPGPYFDWDRIKGRA